jgi:hypothetical protein
VTAEPHSPEINGLLHTLAGLDLEARALELDKYRESRRQRGRAAAWVEMSLAAAEHAAMEIAHAIRRARCAVLHQGESDYDAA